MICRGEKEVKALYRGDKEVAAVYRGENLVWSSGAIEPDTFRGIRGTALYVESPDDLENQVMEMFGMPYEEMLTQIEEELKVDREQARTLLIYQVVTGLFPPHAEINGDLMYIYPASDSTFELPFNEPVRSLYMSDSDSDGNPVQSVELRLDTSGLTSLSSAFQGNKDLTSVDMSACDISSVTGMYAMFAQCSNLKELRMKGFGTSPGLSANYMLLQCHALSHSSLVYTFVEHSHNRRKAGYPIFDLKPVFGGGECPFSATEQARLNEKGYVWDLGSPEGGGSH